MIFLVDGLRTPFLKTDKGPGPFSAADLSQNCGRALLAKIGISATDLDEVIIGQVMPSVEEANIARIIALRLGVDVSTPAYTVQRNCASGLQAIDSAFKDIELGRANLVLAGGTEVMSRAPILFPHDMSSWLISLNKSKSFLKKIRTITKLRPRFFVPIIGLLKGLTDPTVNMNMGHTAEELAYIYKITREQMDEFAYNSHQKVINAQSNDLKNEIEPIFTRCGKVFAEDNGVRLDATIDKLAKLRPVFDRKFGMVTAGNSSQITDGAASVLVANESAVNQHKLEPKARIIGSAWAGVPPEHMGLGPVLAMTKLLKQHSLTFKDIDFFEINEAFAGQVLACLQALQADNYRKDVLNIDPSFGQIALEKLNIDGGAIAIGHPVGASGARLPLHMMYTLHNQNAKFGLISLCIGGGQGGALLLEKI